MKNFAISILVIAIFLAEGGSLNSEENEKSETFSVYVDDKGNITRPTDFRDKWIFLGSWIHPDKNLNEDGFHEVFTQLGVVEKFKKNGNKFPNGAVLVKEVRSAKSASMTTGPNVLHSSDQVLWFVMIKDSKGRFPDNSNWGDGWGWALYYAKDPSKNVSTDYKNDCIGCHIPAKQTDWLYIQGYPSLSK